MSEGVSMEVLKALLAEQAEQNAENLKAVIAAVKQPTKLEQDAIDLKAKNDEADRVNRAETAKGALQTIENKRLAQSVCSHEHPDGKTHCVYITERSGPGYIICQLNQCKIRPGHASPNYKGHDIYDTREFNRIFQKLRQGDEMFM